MNRIETPTWTIPDRMLLLILPERVLKVDKALFHCLQSRCQIVAPWVSAEKSYRSLPGLGYHFRAHPALRTGLLSHRSFRAKSEGSQFLLLLKHALKVMCLDL